MKKQQKPGMPLIERVSRVICRKAAHEQECLFCREEPDCTLWETFQEEAREAISEVRKSDRGKPFQLPHRP